MPGFAEREQGEHRARWLATVDEGYAQMQRCIGAATTSIRLEMYILHEPGPGSELCAALARASARNVQVWLLIDAFGSEDLRPEFLTTLREAGVQVALFNPRRLLRRTFRNHRKLLLVDGASAVVGGFNIGPEYAGDGVAQGWCDTGVFIRGPVVKELEQSFDAMYALAPFNPAAVRRFRRAQRLSMGTGSAHHVTGTGPVQMLTSGPTIPRRLLRRALRHDLRRAKDVAIASAYFLPSSRIRRALYHVTQAAGRVRVLLAGQTDVPLARYAAERFYRRLFRRKVEIHEYQPQILHAKLVIIDDVVYVGSCNLDRRSLRINYEVLLRLHWPELAADARDWFDRALQHAPVVAPREWKTARTLWQRVRSRLAWFLLARVDPLIARRGFRGIS
ncbi:MAG: phospholipase D-like domain-containing protein [Steroidobacteraceae bacterium]